MYSSGDLQRSLQRNKLDFGKNIAALTLLERSIRGRVPRARVFQRKVFCAFGFYPHRIKCHDLKEKVVNYKGKLLFFSTEYYLLVQRY